MKVCDVIPKLPMSNGKMLDLNSGEEIICQERYGGAFIYNKVTKKFLISDVSYLTYIDSGSPVLYAGTCEKF